MTEAERCLWAKIRMKQLEGLQFYRQKPLGKYIVDFYCPKAKLVIELDGGQHYQDEGLLKDQNRDAYLESLGLRVLRFPNSDVLSKTDSVLRSIHGICITSLAKSP